jgi:hypothetical protein
MSAIMLSADDLLPLCAQVQRAGRALEPAPALPRTETLRRLCGYATGRLTHAALANERGEVDREVLHEVLAAADALVFGDQLLEIGVDSAGYVGGWRASAATAVISPDTAERELHAAFAENTAGLPGRLRVVAETLADDVVSEMSSRPVPSREQLELLGDEALGRLREGTAQAPPADPIGREHGMVWLTLCRFCLERALAAAEALADDRGVSEVEAGIRSLPQVPQLYRSLQAPEPDPHLLELCAELAAAN